MSFATSSSRREFTTDIILRRRSAPMADRQPSGWKCKANPTADLPQDCDWPWCGCDPAADKVIEAIQENDCAIVPLTALREVFDLAQAHVMQMPMRNPQRRMQIARAFEDCRRATSTGPCRWPPTQAHARGEGHDSLSGGKDDEQV
jgi:hypothetical protein